MDRRELLIGCGAVALAPRVSLAASDARILRAAPGMASLSDELPDTPVWQYDGATPGPVLRVRQGERLKLRFRNDLPQPSSVHWHGIRIDNAMDGVSGLTQDAVPPGAHFDYDFVAPDAGTYWYHPHNRSWEQMARGLSGALIVEERAPPQVDRDLVLAIDDWRLNEDGAIDEESFGALMDWSHGGRLGNWPTINGGYRPEMPVKRHERLRLRLINTCNATVMPLGLSGFEGRLVALDGQPLAEPQLVPERIDLAPGQRVDLIVDVIAEEMAALNYLLRSGEPYLFASFPVSGEARDAALGEIAPLPPNALPAPDTGKDVLRVELPLRGGAMGGEVSGRIGGHKMTAMMGNGEGAGAEAGEMGLRALAARGFVWTLGDVAGMPAEPLFTARRGETVVMRMENETAWPHAMHLHGHHFREGPEAPWRDTVLIERREAAEIGFVADNPGDWMIHCHMLEHQAGGMATWFRVL